MIWRISTSRTPACCVLCRRHKKQNSSSSSAPRTRKMSETSSDTQGPSPWKLLGSMRRGKRWLLGTTEVAAGTAAARGRIERWGQGGPSTEPGGKIQSHHRPPPRRAPLRLPPQRRPPPREKKRVKRRKIEEAQQAQSRLHRARVLAVTVMPPLPPVRGAPPLEGEAVVVALEGDRRWPRNRHRGAPRGRGGCRDRMVTSWKVFRRMMGVVLKSGVTAVWA